MDRGASTGGGRAAPCRFIVVPEGLAADAERNPLPFPSYVYRNVLDKTLSLAQPGDAIYLAPGNRFGCSVSEHEAGHAYLLARRHDIRIVAPGIRSDSYIDTLGNAVLLRESLDVRASDASFDLVCAYIHSFRAAYCFRKAGYRIARVHKVRYGTSSERIVRRLFFYRHKPAHILYELVATFREIFLRPAVIAGSRLCRG